jgi:hypothetical protein
MTTWKTYLQMEDNINKGLWRGNLRENDCMEDLFIDGG